VTHFLDTLPFDFSQRPAQELVEFLSETYYLQPEAVALVKAAGVKPASIAFGGPMRLVWSDILEKARNQDRLRTLLQVIIDQDDVAVAARVREWLDEEPPTNAEEPAAEPEWRGGDELQISPAPTLLDVAFLGRGAELAAAVCRLRITFPSSRPKLGTAFLVGENLLLTNHHVLFDRRNGNARANGVEAWFGYERGFDGFDDQPYHKVAGLPESIRGDETHDWAVVGLGDPGAPAGTPVIALNGAPPPAAGDRVYIIQHPNGSPKKIGMINNEIRFVDDDVVQYLTDTYAGSSGSPVFDERWRLVALHHRWVEYKRQGEIEYRNQGRRITRVAAGLSAAGIL